MCLGFATQEICSVVRRSGGRMVRSTMEGMGQGKHREQLWEGVLVRVNGGILIP